jgi:5-methylcytosine-specific restriction protein A
MSHRKIADELANKYGIVVTQKRYREDGRWYHHLEHFPAAFFDKNGYIIFNTREEYENCPYLSLGKDVNIQPKGISAIPGYILYRDKETENIENQYTENTLGNSQIDFTEGAIEEMVVELRKRDPRLKIAALQTYGTTCQICGFNFSEVYGNLGDGYIELHHKNPLSERDTIQQTTLDEVAVVCANCHRMLHRNGKNALSVEELAKIIGTQMEKRHINL